MSKLNYVDYESKINQLISSNVRDSSNMPKSSAYNHYMAMATNGYAFDESYVNLSEAFSITFPKNVKTNGYFTEYMFVFYDLKEYFLKRVVSNRFFETGSSDKVIRNAMIVPKIVDLFGLESAKYYITDYWDSDFNDETTDTHLVTPSFLKEDEKMVALNEIISDDFEFKIEKNCEEIYKYFSDKNFDEKNIEQLIEHYIKSICISKLLENTDESNMNFSVIIQKDNTLKMAPLYDYDFCCGNVKKGAIIKNVNDMKSFENFINYYKNESWFREWLEKIVLSANYKKIITDYNGGTNLAKLTPNQKKEYIHFFDSKMQTIKKCLNIKEYMKS